MTTFRPKYITFDCYGTLTWFQPGETAARLKMSEGAVRVALHRALKHLAGLRERFME